MPETYEMIKKATNFIEKQISSEPVTGIILGTGLGKLVDEVDIETKINYKDIPNFPLSTVSGHAGELIFGKLSGRDVVVMSGRVHFYEGYTMRQIVFPIRVMKFLGVKNLIVSNAAGGINPLFSPGTIMAITDHINLLGDNPLIGSNDERIGPRFPDMSEPYDAGFLKKIQRVALENKIPLEKGVYTSMSGPSLETKAEYRMLKILGSDAIGMSTVPEVIAAVHAGLRVLGLSIITDACLPDALEPVDIKKIIAAANSAEPNLVTLVKEVVKEI